MPEVHDFLKTVLRSGLLDREQLRAALQAVSGEQRKDPRALADHLVKTGKLSRFQARKLLQGTALGLVLGPFQVLAPIGRGGMGTVYLARDNRSGMLLALKVLPPKRARAEERLLARFRREMEMCQRVAHPNLAWTYEVGVCQGVYYIALEYIPGQSLSRLVHDGGPLPVPRAARLFAEVASALEHAHVQGLVHRDLKPSNIIVTPNDHAKVLDLGLAIAQGEAPGDRRVVGGQGYVVGTMDYIAPEQTEDPLKADVRSDVYSLGCTLYFALTGRPPFPGGNSQDKIQAHRNREPAPLEQRRPDLPPPFVALVRRMMAKRPEQRFASAAEVEEALHPWSIGEAVRPMDRAGDTGFQQAVSALQTSEVTAEGSVPEIVLPLEVPPGSDEPIPYADLSPAPFPGRLWWVFGLVGLAAPILIALLVFLLTR